SGRQDARLGRESVDCTRSEWGRERVATTRFRRGNVIIDGVRLDPGCQSAQVSLDARDLGAGLGFKEVWDGDCRQDSDDRADDQQLDQGETRFFRLHGILPQGGFDCAASLWW